MKPPIEISVVVVNFNGEGTLSRTLRSVFALQGVNLAQVMLADNHSTDGSVDLVRREFPGVRIHLLPENRGPNPARNAGLNLSRSDIVLIMDNDIALAPDYVVKVAEVFGGSARTGAASGQIRLFDEQDKVQYNGIDIHYVGEVTARPYHLRDNARVACVSAGAAIVNRSMALAVGGFDEDFFFGWEDGDLTFRLSLAGYPCWMVSEAVAYHMQRPRGMKWVRCQTRNRWWFIMKNYDLRTILLALPAILLFQACAGLFLLVKGQFGAFAGGTVEAFAGLRAVRRKRRSVQKLKVVPDIELLRGDRLSLPGSVSCSRAGRMINSAFSIVFHAYWMLIRVFLRRLCHPTVD